MAYEKRTWVSGATPCSSENFNHMEQGIADAHDKLDEIIAKISKDLRSSPVILHSAEIYNTVLNSYEYTTITKLSEYQEVDICVKIGDVHQRVHRVNRSGLTELILSGYYNANYNARLIVTVDFANSRIGVKTTILTGWEYKYVKVVSVTGILKR